MRLTDYLAIYGALLSTAVFIWNAARALPKIRIRLTFAIEGPDDDIQHGIGISIQNPSTHPAHITHVSFLYPYRKATLFGRIKHLFKYRRIPRSEGWCFTALSNFDLSDGCPITIEPGKAHWIFVPHEIVEQVLEDANSRRLKVVVQDALWRSKYSGPFTYDGVSVAETSTPETVNAGQQVPAQAAIGSGSIP